MDKSRADPREEDKITKKKTKSLSDLESEMIQNLFGQSGERFSQNYTTLVCTPYQRVYSNVHCRVTSILVSRWMLITIEHCFLPEQENMIRSDPH
jgi:hypothetical protein